MKISLKVVDKYICYTMVFLAIISMYAFNDQKILLYTIRIFFIIYMSIRLFFVKYKVSKYSLWAIIFLMFTLSSTLWATSQELAIFNFIWAFQVLIVAILMESFIEDKKKLEFVLKCFIIGGLILILRLFIETPIETWGVKRLGTAIDYNANDVGMKLSFATLSTLYFFRTNYKNIYLVLITLLLSIVSLFTGSKKALLVMVLGIFFYYLFSVKKIHKVILAFPLILSGIFLLKYMLYNIEVLYTILGFRIEQMIATFNTEEVQISSSTGIRAEMIETGFKMLADKPFLGYGIGNYSLFSNFETYSHNNYIELLTGIGLIGFIIYYAFYAWLISKILKNFLLGNKFFALPLSILLVIIIIETGLVSYNTGYIQILLVICFSFLKITNLPSNHMRDKEINKEC